MSCGFLIMNGVVIYLNLLFINHHIGSLLLCDLVILTVSFVPKILSFFKEKFALILIRGLEGIFYYIKPI